MKQKLWILPIVIICLLLTVSSALALTWTSFSASAQVANLGYADNSGLVYYAGSSGVYSYNGATDTFLSNPGDCGYGMDVTPNGDIYCLENADSTLYISTNGGTTFTPHLAGVTSGEVAASDAGYILASGSAPGYWTSNNSGTNWTHRVPDGNAYTETAMSSDGHYQIIGTFISGAPVLYSSDYGNSWTNAGNAIGDVGGFALSEDGQTAFYVAAGSGNIYKSNGTFPSVSWSLVKTAGGFGVRIACDENCTKVISASWNEVYYSNDTGATWTAEKTSGNYNGADISRDGNSLYIATFTTTLFENITSPPPVPNPFDITACTVINTPGAYNITQNISATTANCIEVNTSNVAIDGHGYTVDGNSFIRPIYTASSLTNVTLENIIVTGALESVYTSSGASSYTFNNNTFTGSIYASAISNFDFSNNIMTGVDNPTSYALRANAASGTIEDNDISGYNAAFVSIGSHLQPLNIDVKNNLIATTYLIYSGNNGAKFYNNTINTTGFSADGLSGNDVFLYNNSITGNYWTNPTSTGYSDSCTDADGDNTCDFTYTPGYTGQLDNLPISAGQNSNLTTCGILSASNVTYYLQNSLVDSSTYCLTVDGDNVTLDMGGYTIDKNGGIASIIVNGDDFELYGGTLKDYNGIRVFGDRADIHHMTFQATTATAYGAVDLNGNNAKVYDSLITSNVVLDFRIQGDNTEIYNISNGPGANAFIFDGVSDNTTVRDSNLFGNQGGQHHFRGQGGTNVVIRDNTIIHTSVFTGGRLFWQSTPMSFYNNDVYVDNVNMGLIHVSSDFNTTEIVATNIIGGPNTGGNYWTNSTGGYGTTCNDADTDGFCDTPYTFGNINDDLPLTTPGQCTPVWSCSSFGNCTTSDVLPCLNVTDAIGCGDPFNGTLSTYDSTCDYCTPDWVCNGYGECIAETQSQACDSVADLENCFALTGLPSDQYGGNYTEFPEQDCYTPGGYNASDLSKIIVDFVGHFFANYLVYVLLIVLVVLGTWTAVTINKARKENNK